MDVTQKKQRTSKTGISRPYEQSHHWLKFVLDLTHASSKLWMNLGAIQSKCEHVANTMLPPKISGELYLMYLAKGVRATTAIEGNTLSEDEVKQRIKSQSPLPKSQEYMGIEVDNIVKACNEIAGQILGGADCRLSTAGISLLNLKVLNGLPLEDGVIPGAIRNYDVGVADYRGAPHRDCEHLLDRMSQWINDEMHPPSASERIAFGVLRAIMSHLYLAWIHPFGDGNGRTARLVEFQILLGAGVPGVSAHLLSNFYNQTRPEYYRQLSRASKTGGDVLPFVEYAVQGFVDRLDFQIERIRRFQRAITWRDYVYESFSGMKGPAADRQRMVALEMGHRRAGVPIGHIKTVSEDIAAEYHGKTSKTVTRDLNALESMGILVRRGNRVFANRETLQGFLPVRRDEDKRV